jgi:hypothetical protein
MIKRSTNYPTWIEFPACDRYRRKVLSIPSCGNRSIPTQQIQGGSDDYDPPPPPPPLHPTLGPTHPETIPNTCPNHPQRMPKSPPPPKQKKTSMHLKIKNGGSPTGGRSVRLMQPSLGLRELCVKIDPSDQTKLLLSKCLSTKQSTGRNCPCQTNASLPKHWSTRTRTRANPGKPGQTRTQTRANNPGKPGQTRANRAQTRANPGKSDTNLGKPGQTHNPRYRHDIATIRQYIHNKCIYIYIYITYLKLIKTA